MFWYNLIFHIFFILLFPFLLLFYGRKKFYRQNWKNYLGIVDFPKNTKKTILFHSVSVGEISGVNKIINYFQKENYQIVITTTCEDGWRAIQKQYPQALIYILPLDFSWAIKRFLTQIPLSAIFICETDIWPNFIMEANKKKIPVFLLNGRISAGNYALYKTFPNFFSKVFISFSHFFLQSQKEFFYLKKLGIPSSKLTVTGNMKLEKKLDFSHQQTCSLKKKIVVFGSTHAEDENLIIYPSLSKLLAKYRLIIAPRKTERAKQLKKELQIYSDKTLFFSQLTKKEKDNISKLDFDFLIIDVIGELNKLYQYSSLWAYVGGGFKKSGVHNILEPLEKGKLVILGKNFKNFKEIVLELKQKKLAFIIKDKEEFLKTIEKLSNYSRSELEINIRNFFSKYTNISQKIITIIKTYL